MVDIVTDNRENRLDKLREHLFDSKYSRHVIDYSLTKISQQFYILCNTSKIKKFQHKNGYFKECFCFSFKPKNKMMPWHYKRFFSCDTKVGLDCHRLDC